MNQTTVINKISDLNYHGFKEAYLRQIEDTSYNQLSFEERVYNLLEAQCSRHSLSDTQPFFIRTLSRS